MTSKHLILAICAITSLPLAGCGYHFQAADNPLVNLGIRNIYVAGFRNQSYRPGIEHYFTTAMIREIAQSKSFNLVNSEADADAVVSGTIDSAEDGTGAAIMVKVPNSADVPVAIEYNATVSCSVILKDRRGRQIFSQSVTDNKIHPGSAGRGDPASASAGDAGVTAPLINDSEQRLAIQFLATEMISSVYQRMVDTF